VNPVDDYSYDGAMPSVEESVERMGIDRIDVVHIHEPESHYEQALNGAYVALERLRDAGVVGAIGVGSGDVGLLSRLAREAADHAQAGSELRQQAQDLLSRIGS
jgi:D-threo-aldose 1-dehydrogenase